MGSFSPSEPRPGAPGGSSGKACTWRTASDTRRKVNERLIDDSIVIYMQENVVAELRE
jgi:hypothetical protein